MSKLLNNILEDSILWFSFGREKAISCPCWSMMYLQNSRLVVAGSIRLMKL